MYLWVISSHSGSARCDVPEEVATCEPEAHARDTSVLVPRRCFLLHHIRSCQICDEPLPELGQISDGHSAFSDD